MSATQRSDTRIRDIVHGYLPIETEDVPLLACPLVQRLRHIRQNDLDYLVYPNVNTSRFEHSLGVMYVAGRLAESLLANTEKRLLGTYLQELGDSIPQEQRSFRDTGDLEAIFRRSARWYGLLHDVGHLPFSHLTEHAVVRAHKKQDVLGRLYPRARSRGFDKLHEAAASSVLELKSVQSAMETQKEVAWIVTTLLATKKGVPSVLRPLKDMVDSDVDADRIDATARDGLLAGGDFGRFDTSRLIQNIQLHKLHGAWRALFTTRAIVAIEGLLMERYKTYRWIHFHPKVMALKNAFGLCISAVNMKLGDWGHRHYYDSSRGFLDDARILNKLWALRPGSMAVHNARNAVLLDRELVASLWKRRDEFWEICRDVASCNATWSQENAQTPVLNRFAGSAADLLQGKLNEGSSDEEYFLVSQTKLKPIELFGHSSDDSTVAQRSIYHVLSDNGGPAPLSQKSPLIERLPDIVKRDPAISVSVLTSSPMSESSEKRVRDRFIDVAREALSQLEDKQHVAQ